MIKPDKTILIIGATNVGKSTLFNKLSRSRKAIVADRSGVTVDAHSILMSDPVHGVVEIVDSGGVGPKRSDNPLQEQINLAAAKAVSRADIVLFVVDGSRDPSADDLFVLDWFRKQKVKVPLWGIFNKLDRGDFSPHGYYRFSFEESIEMSAEHGSGLGEFLDKLAQLWGHSIDFEGYAAAASVEPRVVVLGRPNTGKSTLLNSLLGRQRHVTSDQAGTTRDVVESDFYAGGINWRLFDTAGLRRPGRLERQVEWVAKEKLKDNIRLSDIAIVVMDASEAVTDLDANIAGMAVDYGNGLILVLNKWDLVKDDPYKQENIQRQLDLKLKGFAWCRVLQTEALVGKGTEALVKEIKKVHQARAKRISTGELNRFFEAKVKSHPAPLFKGQIKVSKLYYMTQVGQSPPEFVIMANVTADEIHYSYHRYLVNSLREEFGFFGTPIRLHFKKNKKAPFKTDKLGNSVRVHG